MLIFIYIIIGVYLTAINIYAVILMKEQRKSIDDCDNNNKVHDGKIFITALLGGAAGFYFYMLTKKYRLKSLFLMVMLPVLIAMNIYFLILAFRSNFWFMT